MWVARSIPDLAPLPPPLHIAIGTFDGLHVGHRSVIDATIRAARELGGTAVVLSFDPHPRQLLRPEHAPALLTPPALKERVLRRIGVTHHLLLPFTRALAQTPAGEFIRALAAPASLRTIAVGEAWAFGRQRSGNVPLLRALGDELHFSVRALPAVLHAGFKVSSTRIRKEILAGDLAGAAAMLGRPHSILGTVRPGRSLGRTIGFPTANLYPDADLLPPAGVYAAVARIDESPHPGVLNLGTRPTVDPGATRQVLEIHLFDPPPSDLLGREMEVEFHAFLRPERRFDSLDELRTQIAADRDAARRVGQPTDR